jgi:POT family proton-dependent oligopeptide transporter
MRQLLSALRVHPPGLALLFFTETWERFSFYGMRALLVLYMTEQLLIPANAHRVLGYGPLRTALESVFGPMSTQALSSQVYGLYTSLLYFTPVLGGLLADRVLGQFRAVVLGASLMAVGHFLMASDRLFLVALLCIIVGNGFFKPNVSTQVGRLYSRTDSRRDSAFSIFYMGINLGATVAPVVCGTLGEVYGWHYGFAAAGVGMVIGLVIYIA